MADTLKHNKVQAVLESAARGSVALFEYEGRGSA